MGISELHFYNDEGYSVYIGKNCVSAILPSISKQYSKALIITDNNVAPLWLDKVSANITCPVISYIAGEGEDIKTLSALNSVWSFLSENSFDRKSAIIALGGGTVGDLSGFAAATYMRGIDLLMIPTTLLSMTDSSVGGKNGINTDFSKNTVGTIYRPAAVICDTAFLDTLPVDQYKSGMGEVIKYSYIGVNNLKSALLAPLADIEKIIEECLNIKKYTVENDEFDTGLRQMLNFGHTIGHAVEKLSNFSVPHGVCVAYGAMCVIRAEVRLGLLPESYLSEIKYLIDTCSLNVNPSFSADEILNLTTKDKKNCNGKIRFICLDSNGSLYINEMDDNAAIEFIRHGIGD